jgi:hypothetical protein
MVDVSALRKAHEDFLAVAEGGGFGPPPAGEWDAERLVAHVGLTDAAIASVALAALAGQRPSYDNRASLDEWNLRRVVSGHGDLDGVIEFARTSGRLLREVAAGLPGPVLAVSVPVLIISNDALVVDAPRPLNDLIAGIAEFHLPQHAEQLARLR